MQWVVGCHEGGFGWLWGLGCVISYLLFVISFFLREGLSKKIEIENKCQTHSSFFGMNNRKLVLVKNSQKNKIKKKKKNPILKTQNSK